MKRIRHRVAGAAIGLTLGWYLAALPMPWISVSGAPLTPSTAVAAPAGAEPHDAEHHDAHHADPGQLAAARLVPTSSDAKFMVWVIPMAAGLFLAALFLGERALRAAPQEPEADDHGHGHDDHGHDNHGHAQH